MLKYIGNIKTTALMLLLAAAFTACSSDVAEDPIGPSTGNKVKVNLTIGVQPAHNATRAATEEVGTDNENMFSWFVIAVKGGKVAAIWDNTTKGNANLQDVTEDQIKNVELETGNYDFYSFANISRSDITALRDLTVGATMSDLSQATFSVNGNGFDIINHIPMSNKETINITATGESHELHVVRMLAKVTLELKNETESEMKVSSATLSDITPNTNGNIFLLPQTGNSTTTVNLPQGVQAANYTRDFADEVIIPAGETKSVSFYINESSKPNNIRGLFILTLETGTDIKRYALISNDDNEWDYIARNDHRVIPVILQDYKLDIIPKDFPPIAVLPASVKEEDGLFTVTFHAPGHFHLEPVVTKYGDTNPLTYGTATNQWEYVTDGWKTIDVPTGFYLTDNASGLAADGCENGGFPEWVADSHFIIGNLEDDYADNYIAKKAFHDLTVKVHTEGTPAERQLTYHLCIIKDLAY